MKLLIRSVLAMTALAVASPLFAESSAPLSSSSSTESSTDGKKVKKEIRFIHGDHGPMEMESVTFLGVQASPVSPTLIAQLNLPDHSGLVVLEIVKDSAAAGVLKEHDILLKLDEQILIDEHQLAVLVRNHKEGDQVTLTYVRGGKQATASVKLTKHDVPKMSGMLHGAPHAMPMFGGPNRLGDMLAPKAEVDDVNRELSLIERAHGGDPVDVKFERIVTGPGFRGVKINTGNSNLVYSDDNGSLQLTIKDGEKKLVAKDAKGAPQFSGPVTTPEERKVMPDNVRARLEKLESMQDVTFQTDSDFMGAETRVFTPEARPIRAPLPPPHAPPARSL
jgi:serine protease Do